MFVRIFSHDDPIVDDHGNRQGNAGQRHDVGRDPKCIQQNKAGCNGDRDLYDYTRSASPVKQKNDHYHGHHDDLFDKCCLYRRD